MRSTLLPLLFLFTISSIALLGEARPDPVFDTTGKRVRAGVEYNIFASLQRTQGGGFTLGSIGNNNSCPLYVVQEHNEILKGLPVTFARHDGKDIIHTSTDLNIVTSGVFICIESNAWRLLEELIGVWFVSANGVKGNPSVQTISSWFKIERADGFYNGYYLSFCPTVTPGKTLCRQLGIFNDENGQRHLALSDEIPPFRLVFQRASCFSSSGLLLNKAEGF